MRYIFILLLAPVFASAQIVGVNGTDPRVVVVPVSTNADSILVKNTSGQFSTVHKQNIWGTSTVNDGNVRLGQSAGGALVATSALGNIAIGREALLQATTADFNVVLGQAGARILNSNGGVYIGYAVASTQQVGDRGIAIGYSLLMPDNAAANQMNIGNAIYGTSINNTTGFTYATGGRIGILRRRPSATFEVGGLGNATSGLYYGSLVTPHINQSGSAGFTINGIYPYIQATGSGVKKLWAIGTSSDDSLSGTLTDFAHIRHDGQFYTSDPAVGTSTDSIYIRENGVFKTIAASALGLGSVTSVATSAGTGLTGGTITSTGTIGIDTLLISTRAWRQKAVDSLSALISALAAVNQSGTYTPTASAPSGITVGTIEPFTWSRSSTGVTISGYVATTGATPGTPATFELSLPASVASNLTTEYELTGNVSSIVPGSDGWVKGSAANNTAVIQWVGGATAGSQGLRIMFHYPILP